MLPELEERILADWQSSIPAEFRPGHHKDKGQGAIIVSDHGPPGPRLWASCPRQPHGERTKRLGKNPMPDTIAPAANGLAPETAPQPRARRTPEEKAAIVAEANVEGAIAAQVAQRHGLAPGTLAVWRADRRKQQANGSAKPAMTKDSAETETTTKETSPPQAIEIEAGGIKVRIPASQEMAAAVIAALISHDGARAHD